MKRAVFVSCICSALIFIFSLSFIAPVRAADDSIVATLVKTGKWLMSVDISGQRDYRQSIHLFMQNGKLAGTGGREKTPLEKIIVSNDSVSFSLDNREGYPRIFKITRSGGKLKGTISGKRGGGFYSGYFTMRARGGSR
jgi:hypothetical protein